MASKITTKEFIEKWTADLDEQLQEAGAKTVCPMCGRDDWSLMAAADEDGEILGWGIPMFRHRTIGGYIPAAALACRNCGFVRQHVFLPQKEE